MQLSDLSSFFSLSRTINYNLSDTTSGRYYVLNYITDKKKFTDQSEKSIVMHSLTYLFNLYTDKFRELGPPAVLHPLRAGALLSRAVDSDQVNTVELLTILFHDVLEDLQADDIQTELYDLLADDPQRQATLVRQLQFMTRSDQETYNDYIGRLLEYTPNPNDLVRIKLADRLDNTLDMRIDLEEHWGGEDFFEMIFSILFGRSKPPEEPPELMHPPKGPLNGAQRLYQLFKNTVLLSLIRQKAKLTLDAASETLFEAVATASLKEVQRIFMHIMIYHVRTLKDPKEDLMAAMVYCYSGKTDMITVPGGDETLDGLFSSYFDHETYDERKKKLNRLYTNKSLMAQTTMAFTVIFLNFLKDPDYFVRGISPDGIHPE